MATGTTTRAVNIQLEGGSSRQDHGQRQMTEHPILSQKTAKNEIWSSPHLLDRRPRRVPQNWPSIKIFFSFAN